MRFGKTGFSWQTAAPEPKREAGLNIVWWQSWRDTEGTFCLRMCSIQMLKSQIMNINEDMMSIKKSGWKKNPKHKTMLWWRRLAWKYNTVREMKLSTMNTTPKWERTEMLMALRHTATYWLDTVNTPSHRGAGGTGHLTLRQILDIPKWSFYKE